MKLTKLETDRLIIRRFSENDLHDLYEYLSDRDVVIFEPYQAMDIEEQKTLNERMQSDEFMAIVEKLSGKVTGNIYTGERYCESLIQNSIRCNKKGGEDERIYQVNKY